MTLLNPFEALGLIGYAQAGKRVLVVMENQSAVNQALDALYQFAIHIPSAFVHRSVGNERVTIAAPDPGRVGVIHVHSKGRMVRGLSLDYVLMKVELTTIREREAEIAVAASPEGLVVWAGK